MDIPAPATEKKTRKPRAPKTSPDLQDLQSNMSFLIMAGYEMAAKLLKSPVWSISPDEAQTIAIPASKILDRLNATENMNKYADYFALLAAVSVVTIPRVIVTMETQKKTAPVRGVTNDRPRPVEATNTKPNPEPITRSAPVVSDIGKAAFDLGGF